jgi:putative endonuclease
MLTQWPWWRRWFGNRSERAAARYLRRRGFHLISHNYRCSQGEIDLIAVDGRELVFVEIRSTESPDPEIPAASVDREKQRRLTKAALHFLHRKRLRDPVCRFDVIAIAWPPGHAEPRIEHYPHAFEAVGRYQMDC